MIYFKCRQQGPVVTIPSSIRWRSEKAAVALLGFMAPGTSNHNGRP